MSSFFFYPSGILQRSEAELRLQEDAGAFAPATQFLSGLVSGSQSLQNNSLQLSSPTHTPGSQKKAPAPNLPGERARGRGSAGWAEKDRSTTLNPTLQDALCALTSLPEPAKLEKTSKPINPSIIPGFQPALLTQSQF